MSEQMSDEQAAAEIVRRLKSKGIFDQIRRDCLADITTKSSYLNLTQRIDGNVKNFLKSQNWHSSLNKNQLREKLRNNLNECGLIKGGVSYLVEQVVNPSNFESKIEDEVSFFLGLEKSDLAELGADKLDDISDDDDEILKTDFGSDERESEPKEIDKETCKETNSKDLMPQCSKSTLEPRMDEKDQIDDRSKESKPKMSEEEFSKKFKNTFSSTNEETNDNKPATSATESKPVDVPLSCNDLIDSNSSISDGSLPSAPSPEPLDSTKSTSSNLLSTKIEDEIANQLEKDIASVQQIYKDFVNEGSVNANPAQFTKSSREDDCESKTKFTASQLTFKDKFRFTGDRQDEISNDSTENPSRDEEDISMDNDQFESLDNDKPEEFDCPKESSSSVEVTKVTEQTSIEVKETVDESIELKSIKIEKQTSIEVNKSIETKQDDLEMSSNEIDPPKSDKEELNQESIGQDQMEQNIPEVKSEPIDKQNKSNEFDARLESKPEDQSKSNKQSNQSDPIKNQRVAKEKSEKLAKIQNELREKRDLVRCKLKGEPSSSKKTSKDESIVRRKSIDKSTSSKSTKLLKPDKEKSKVGGKDLEKKSFKKLKNSSSVDSTKSKQLIQDSNDYASDVSSVHTSDLSDFDDQISLSSSDDEEHNKKKISMQQLKQILD